MDESFEQLRRDMLRYLRARGAAVEDAEDCVQAALLELWSAVSAGKSPVNCRAWTSTVAWRRLVDLHREQGRRRRLVRPEISSVGVDEEVTDRELAAWLVARLARLPETSQEVCRLLGEGKTSLEVAAALGLTHRAVESHLTRVRKFLRAQVVLGWACCLAALGALVRMARSLSVTAVVAPATLATATCVGVVVLAPPADAPAPPVVEDVRPVAVAPERAPRVETPVTVLPVTPQQEPEPILDRVGDIPDAPVQICSEPTCHEALEEPAGVVARPDLGRLDVDGGGLVRLAVPRTPLR